MRLKPIQTSFAAGELSQHLRGRVDAELYGQGLDYCENFEVLPHGPMRTRPGSKFIATLPSEPGRLVPFRTKAGERYVLALLEQKLRIYTEAGAVAAGGANLITNGDFPTDLTGWIVNGGAEWVAGHVEIRDANQYPTADRIFQGSKSLTGGTEYRLTFKVSASHFTSQTVLRVIWKSQSFETYLDVNIHSLGTGYVTMSYSVTAPASRTDVYVNFEVGGQSSSVRYRIDDIQLYATGTVTEIATPWTLDQLPLLQYALDPSQSRILFAHPNVEPRTLTYADPTWTLAIPTWTSKPGTWTGTNWPAVVELFQGRAWYAAPPDSPTEVWASKPGGIADFAVSAPVVAGDAIVGLKLATAGLIRWLRGNQRVILVGTEGYEGTIRSEGPVITPLDVGTTLDSLFGSAAKMPAWAGDRIVYISPSGRKLRAVQFDAAVAERWVSQEVSFQGEHILRDGVREVHFGSDPNGTLVAVLASDQIAACTLGGGAGWWRFTSVDPILLATVQAGEFGAELWLAARRGASVRLEQVKLHDEAETPLDSFVSAMSDPVGVVSGLGHLDGRTVRVIANGIVLDDQVVASGAITVVDYPETLISVGLGYTARALTLPRPSAAGKARFVRIGVRLYDSALPKLNTWRPAERDAATAWDEPTARATGKAEIRAVGWDSEAQVTIEQDLPIRTEILALYAVVAESEA